MNRSNIPLAPLTYEQFLEKLSEMGLRCYHRFEPQNTFGIGKEKWSDDEITQMGFIFNNYSYADIIYLIKQHPPL